MGSGLHFDNLEHLGAFVKGRTAHHKRMQREATERRQRLLVLVRSGQYEPKASQALADALGCGRNTLWRDLRRLELDAGRCPHCGQLLPAALEFAVAAAVED